MSRTRNIKPVERLKIADMHVFLKDECPVSVSQICEEAGVSRFTMHYWLYKSRSNVVPQRKADKLLPVLKRYGYEPKEE